MTPSARVQSVLDLLEALARESRPADGLLAAWLRARRYIGSKDRAAISTRFYAVLRHFRRLDWSLARHQIPMTPRARLLAWLALGEGIAATDLATLFSGGTYAPAALTSDELKAWRKLQGHTLTHPSMPEDVQTECPPALFAPLKQKFGAAFLKEMQAMLEPAPLDLRVNLLKMTQEAALQDLRAAGLKAEICPFSPVGLRVFGRPSLNTLPMLKDGAIEIQDEGSQLVALAVEAKPGERIVDFCAGAGGKTLALGAMMANKGRIIACDISEKRLRSGTARFRRAGLHNIETRTLVGTRDPWVKKHKESFDRVLADAPCSGTGTWRRNPDTRGSQLGPSLPDLLKTQAEILDSAARLVKKGGRLVYATCSLLPEENEDQIAAFLAAHPDFSVVPCGMNGADFLSLTPHRHGTDGFFAAALERGV